MKLEFIGADHEVTGSCHYIECGKTKLLVDYGMEQGVNVYENMELPVPPSEIQYVLITHAHIDHSGLLPLLYTHGFRGVIYTTAATEELCDIMLRDSAHIQESEAEWKNRKAMRSGGSQVEPLFTVQDATDVQKLIESVDYGEKVKVSDEVTVRFIDVGHLLGSASIEMWLKEGDEERKIVFSGDIGNVGKPLIRDPQYIDEADYVLTEATYGDRVHEPGVDHTVELAAILQRTLDRGGNVVIPAFAVGRTQEILFYIRKIKKDGLVHGHDNFEVWVDSPLAVEATEVFKNNIMDCFDDETQELVRQGINPISFKGLRTAITSDESKAINFDEKPKVIISAAGMCDAGRVRHHLKHNLWRPESTIVFAGYQSIGTLGRSLQEGATEVKLFGETVQVHAEIATLQAISGHADMNGLIKWNTAFKKTPLKTFIVHGDDLVCDTFATKLHDEYKLNTEAPFSGSVYDLIANAWITKTVGIPIDKKVEVEKRTNSVYVRLKSAGDRLITVIKESEGGANKDLAKFADQINALCDKWGRQ